MAKRLLVELIDDIDDEPILTGGEHIEFSVNGQNYEIDLGDDNAREFRRKLDYYIAHSDRVGTRKLAASATASAAESSTVRHPDQTRAIRTWAQAQGFNVSARGRIPAVVEKAFEAAH